ncbi:McrB family protein [Pyxidicoccus xibeiensis]|uniref:McrB family protein n=1 Tax=Pyxidicoccus xibeiensis TaxID=2906759 RepID=UPI0020A74D98|nr:ATP-binding protein [Pyxidicoccus xibeiensis]MCP3143104.1 ATP-binding protein [Pyxidicoccus xibeiensis]
MPSPKLTDDQLRELFLKASRVPEWEEWRKKYGAFLQRIANLSTSELAAPARQEELWRARDITPVGPGEAVNVDGAYADRQVVHALVSLKTRTWSTDPRERANQVQAEFDRILELVHPRLSKSRPQARLGRAFAALLPGELHCVFNFTAEKNVATLLDLNPDAGRMGRHVLARARLRDALGPERSLADHVQRSTFCWWLHEQYATLAAGGGVTNTNVRLPEAFETAPLVLWPGPKQFRGLAAIKGLSAFFRDIVKNSLAGAEPKELVQMLRADPTYSALAEKTLRGIVSNAKSCGLIELKDGVLVPTEKGTELLESAEPDALSELLLVRVFPMAHLLRILSASPLPSAEVISRVRKLYSGWTADQAASFAVAWLRDLRLVDRDLNGLLYLTASGELWHKRLPDELPLPIPSVPAQEEELESPVTTPAPVAANAPQWPDLEQLLTAFESDASTAALVVDRPQLAALHLAWHCNEQKRFVLLSGLSGTGKTKVVKSYAELYCKHLKLDPRDHMALVPVSPDWSDPAGLLGYYNPLHEDPTYQSEAATRLLIAASRDPSRPYFLLLDEMNLARVERYFAPLLSAMESGEDLVLHANDEDVNGVPPRLRWPRNLFIAGTVNMDETTYPFSDKVLDRAFTLEFWEVNLPDFFKRQTKRNEEAEQVLLTLNELLRPIRRHFGYRTAGEVLAFVGTSVSGVSPSALLDQALFSKVLPRLRGERSAALETALGKALQLCQERGLTRCSAKLLGMKTMLEELGIVKFWA